jgi:3-dehydroquinate dehydratase-2
VRVDVLNGVNLDMLGKRDPALYGTGTLDELETQIYTWGRELGLQVRCRQTNHEGEFVEFCHAALGNADGVVVNPGSWTHYAWSIHDALEPFAGPVVEVHISDVNAREEWRKFSVLEGLTAARVIGKGIPGYREALAFLASKGTKA